MKSVFATLALLAAASPALAHSGAHLHPHADQSVPVLVVLAALSAFAVAATVVIRGHK